MSVKTVGTFRVHGHSELDPKRHWSLPKELTHSHADGERGHFHEGRSLGPAHFGYGKAKFTVKPTSEQLAYRERTYEESHFEVVFSGDWSPEHERAGLDRAEWERSRDDFIQAQLGPMPEREETGAPTGMAVRRMVETFDLTPIYRYDPPPVNVDESEGVTEKPTLAAEWVTPHLWKTCERCYGDKNVFALKLMYQVPTYLCRDCLLSALVVVTREEATV